MPRSILWGSTVDIKLPDMWIKTLDPQIFLYPGCWTLEKGWHQIPRVHILANKLRKNKLYGSLQKISCIMQE